MKSIQQRASYVLFAAATLATIATASIALAALTTTSGKVTNVKTCMDGTTPHCLFKHTGDANWYSTGSLAGASTSAQLSREACSTAKSALVSYRTVVTKYTNSATICGDASTRQLYNGDTGAGVELQ